MSNIATTPQRKPSNASGVGHAGDLGEQVSSRSNKRELDEDESDADDDEKPEKRAGRRKIKIEYIDDKSRRHITFSKRKAGIMKKAYELSTLTGTQVLLLVVSETGL
ncbi:3252_t:CDS:2, partial [Ambispora leptoticha]